MGQDQTLFKQMMRLILPDILIEHFEVKQIKEKKEEYQIILDEKKDLIPDKLKEEDVCLDGFCDPIELQGFPQKGKPLYIKIYRRRWKKKGSDKHYSNQYNLNDEGMKATKEFGAFLKENFGCGTVEYNNIRKSVMC